MVSVTINPFKERGVFAEKDLKVNGLALYGITTHANLKDTNDKLKIANVAIRGYDKTFKFQLAECPPSAAVARNFKREAWSHI